MQPLRFAADPKARLVYVVDRCRGLGSVTHRRNVEALGTIVADRAKVAVTSRTPKRSVISKARHISGRNW